MPTLTLTKDQTCALLVMRDIQFWKTLNVSTKDQDLGECDPYLAAANYYNDLEDQIDNATEVWGTNEDDETGPVPAYPSHPNPLITRPRFED